MGQRMDDGAGGEGGGGWKAAPRPGASQTSAHAFLVY